MGIVDTERLRELIREKLNRGALPLPGVMLPIAMHRGSGQRCEACDQRILPSDSTPTGTRDKSGKDRWLHKRCAQLVDEERVRQARLRRGVPR